ncbi:MAG: UDP-N-acetylmuramoyl-tripeptide--D-alanyl-D-alanine ligase [Firmicutes bacterium]|nr:UDP-N-acetylmuramoyl-tripeptide--D-alanyl-D-alanine ligase [Bacillota bacterium]
MIRSRLSFVAEACAGELSGNDVTFAGVVTDSRQDVAGRLFIPLSGPSFDGHDYCQTAMEQGAAAFLWQRDRELPPALAGQPHVCVNDALVALQKLAAAYRRGHRAKVVAVTGSNGKTSTKDLVAAVLATRYKTYKTPGNLNSHIGLPLCILDWEPDVEVAVLEMGMRGRGQIAELCSIARPDIGAITIIGEAHLELLGTRAAIAAAKWELIASLPMGGLAVLPDDEPLLAPLAVPSGVGVKTFGQTPKADLQMVSYQPLGQGSEIVVAGLGEPVRLPTPGVHQGRNALIALLIAAHMEIDLMTAAHALAHAELTGQRMSVQECGLVTVIDDSYNASPVSMQAGLQVLKDIDCDKRVAVLGDMLELGENAVSMHEQIGDALAEYGVTALVAVGDLATAYARRAQASGVSVIASVATAHDAVLPLLRYLAAQEGQRLALLCKGSNRMGLGTVAKAVQEAYADDASV